MQRRTPLQHVPARSLTSLRDRAAILATPPIFGDGVASHPAISPPPIHP